MFNVKHLLLLISFFSVPLTAVAESDPGSGDAGRALLQLQAFSNNLDTFSASFEQVIISPNGHAGDALEGKFSLSRPNLFRWDYAGEFPQLIIGDGTKIWIHDIELEQVSVKAQPQTVAESPALLLLQPESLDDYFVIADLGESEGLALLSLTPKTEDPTFERILLGLSDNLPGLLVIEDGFGQRTEIRFSQQQLNQPMSPQEFIFTAPEGADIIGDVPVVMGNQELQ